MGDGWDGSGLQQAVQVKEREVGKEKEGGGKGGMRVRIGAVKAKGTLMKLGNS